MISLNKYKNFFLDRDGVINDVVIRGEKISSPRVIEEFNLREDFIHFSKFPFQKSINFFVVTNQPDISRNLLKSETLSLIHKKIKNIFPLIKEIKYCPHDDYHKCDCRKPNPGMILDLIKKYNLDLNKSIIIGDTERDIRAGINAKIDQCLMRTKYNDQIHSVHKINNLIDLIS